MDATHACGRHIGDLRRIKMHDGWLHRSPLFHLFYLVEIRIGSSFKRSPAPTRGAERQNMQYENGNYMTLIPSAEAGAE